MGILTYENPIWKFCYSEEIKKAPEWNTKFWDFDFPDKP